MTENLFGKNLSTLRKQAGFSQKEFAEKLNIPPTTFANYENSVGAEPKFNVLIKIAEILGVSIDTLLTGRTIPAKSVSQLSENSNKIFRLVTDSDGQAFEKKLNETADKMQDENFLLSEVKFSACQNSFSALLIFAAS